MDPDTLNQQTDMALSALEVVGTVAFAVSGALAARRARMDWFGIVVLAAAGVVRWVGIWIPVIVALLLRTVVVWRGWSAPTYGPSR